jgi:hypothetical protein
MRQSTPQQEPYIFKSLIYCGICHRKMQGNHVRGDVYYRCRFSQEYALANRVDHPRNVLLREDVLVEPIDRWLAQAFAPAHRERTGLRHSRRS